MNRLGSRAVIPVTGMNEAVSHVPGVVVTVERALEQEFEEAVRATVDLAIRVACGVLRRREDAEEVAQEAFTRAHARFASLRDLPQFKAWVVRVTWRLAIDRWRADRRRQAREQLSVRDRADAGSVEDDALRAERSALLWDAIAALPLKLRQAVVLCAVEGQDIRRAAALLGVPEGTVKSRLFLARAALAEKLTCLANDSGAR